jgi:tRNA pseudouridine55 synthase
MNEALKPGFINVNKPAGMTAHDVVARLRKILSVKQVGHAGTLDPMATGVLPVAVGRACRLLRFLDGTKVYLADILLGQRTTTDDIEGEIVSRSDQIPAPDVVREELLSFAGKQQQVPPLYSAVQVGGRRLYEIARCGDPPPEIPVRQVEVYSIDVQHVGERQIIARISCGAGTYIRSIARDLGDRLQCGGCLQALSREAAGPFTLDKSLTLEEIAALANQNQIELLIQDAAPFLNLPAIVLGEEQARAICLGQVIKLNLEDCPETTATSSQSSKTTDSHSAYVQLCFNQQLVAIGETNANNGSLTVKPEVVLKDGKDIG